MTIGLDRRETRRDTGSNLLPIACLQPKGWRHAMGNKLDPVSRLVSRRSKPIVIVVCASLLLTGYASAQTVSGSIAGTVIDATQAAVGNAEVNAVEQNKRKIGRASCRERV